MLQVIERFAIDKGLRQVDFDKVPNGTVLRFKNFVGDFIPVIKVHPNQLHTEIPKTVMGVFLNLYSFTLGIIHEGEQKDFYAVEGAGMEVRYLKSRGIRP